MSWQLRAVRVGAVTGALALGMCATASAAVTPKSSTATVPDHNVVSTTATCGPGEFVSSAGFTAAINDTQATLPTAMAPTATGVKVAAGNPGDAGPITATAYCDSPAKAPAKAKKKKKKKKGKGKSAAAAKKKKKKKKKKKPAAPVPPPTAVSASGPTDGPFGSGTVTVNCPAGTTVRAGGYDTNADADDIVFLSSLEMTTPTSVTVNVKRFGPVNEEKTVTAIALCGQGAPLTAFPGNVAPIPDDGAATSTATCGSGKLGWVGFKEGNFGAAFPTGIARASDTSGTATAFALSSSQTVQAIAYCG